jgi:hypothetical protein
MTEVMCDIESCPHNNNKKCLKSSIAIDTCGLCNGKLYYGVGSKQTTTLKDKVIMIERWEGIDGSCCDCRSAICECNKIYDQDSCYG